MAKPKIIFRNGRWIVNSDLYPGCPFVVAEGLSVVNAWKNYVQAHKELTTDYVSEMLGFPRGFYFAEIKQECLIHRVRRFLRG